MSDDPVTFTLFCGAICQREPLTARIRELEAERDHWRKNEQERGEELLRVGAERDALRQTVAARGDHIDMLMADMDKLRALLLNTRASMVAVLCDHDERCCIGGTNADRAEIDNAIAAIDAELKEPRI